MLHKNQLAKSRHFLVAGFLEILYNTFDGKDLSLYRRYFAHQEPDDLMINGENKKYADFEQMHQVYLDINDDMKLNLADLVQVRIMLATQA